MEDRGASVRVGIHDRGPGIPETFRSRIFGRFAQADSSMTRQKGGTGLGLAICKRLVELMDGRIGYADRDGGGTVFYFDLPKHGAA
jgi:signal transduction histidine kinase